MKMIVEHEYADERTTPITIAQAIISFAIAEHEDEIRGCILRNHEIDFHDRQIWEIGGLIDD